MYLYRYTGNSCLSFRPLINSADFYVLCVIHLFCIGFCFIPWSTALKIRQKFRECQDSNPGRLVEKRHLCYAVSLKNRNLTFVNMFGTIPFKCTLYPVEPKLLIGVVITDP